MKEDYKVSSRIDLKTPAEIEIIARGGRIIHEVFERIADHVKPGVTTIELDRVAKQMIDARGARPAFLGYNGFPGTLCISVNEEIVHGIPGKRRLEEGDIVSIDVGVILDGFYSDSARTFPVGQVDETSRRLLDVTREALRRGIEQLRVGKRVGDYSHAVQSYVEPQGFSLVREYSGHGLGRSLHEDPKIPNYGKAGRGLRWEAGMVVAVEPMVNVGTHRTRELADHWTVVTADGSRSAHFEHTVAITEDGPRILT